MYVSGVNNYHTYEEALRQFHRLESKAAISKHKDGAGSITFLQDKPLMKGQMEYNPIGSDVKYNF